MTHPNNLQEELNRLQSLIFDRNIHKNKILDILFGSTQGKDLDDSSMITYHLALLSAVIGSYFQQLFKQTGIDLRKEFADVIVSIPLKSNQKVQ